MAYFSQFNTGYLFDLPESLTSKSREERYLSTAAAAEQFGDAVVPVIAFGVSKNHSEDAVTEENGWVATEEVQINVPEHQIPILKKMMADRNAVKLCKRNKQKRIDKRYGKRIGIYIRIPFKALIELGQIKNDRRYCRNGKTDCLAVIHVRSEDTPYDEHGDTACR